MTSVVLFATQLYPLAAGRSSGFGGAETELWSVAQELGAHADLEVRVLTLTDELAEPRRFGNVILHPVQPSQKLTYRDAWWKRRWAIAFYYVNLFRKLRKQQADIYFSKLASSEASAVWLASRLAGGKYVFRIEHDWETNPRDLTEIIFRGSRFWAKVFLYCLKRADLVVAQTQKQAEHLKRNYGVNCVLIPNGHVIPADAEVEPDPQKRPTVLWVARVHPMKRPELFLDMAERHKGVSFTMIMAPNPEHEELFEKCRARAEALNNVEFVSGVAPSEINRYYQRARLFVLTSEAEGFSNVIIEALKNGAPALSLGHNPDNMLVPMDENQGLQPAAGFFADENMAAASALIERVFSDETFWLESHQQARVVATELFGIENVVDRYREEFEKLRGSK